MATGTGMGTNGSTQKKSSLTPQQQAKLDKAKKPMEIANKFRLFFLFIAVLALLFLYFGAKFWEGLDWFESTRQIMYYFLSWDVLLMLAATFIKFFFVSKYNKVVKNL